MALLFLFGARCHDHHDIIGAQWGNLLMPLYDIIVFLFLGFSPAGDLVVVVVVVGASPLGTTLFLKWTIMEKGWGGGGVVPC